MVRDRDQTLVDQAGEELVAIRDTSWAIAVVTGLWGVFVPFFLGVQLIWVVVITHAVPSAVIGFLRPQRWYVALIAMWGGLLWCFVLPVLVFLKHGRWSVSVSYPLIELWVIVPAVCLGALLGKRLAHWWYDRRS